MKTVFNFINGEISEYQTERVAPIFDPATGQQTKQVALSLSLIHI